MNPKIIGLIGTGASVLGVQAATKGLDTTWKKVTGRQVPSKNDDPREDRWLDIVLFAVVSGVLTTVVRTLVNRQVAEQREKAELKEQEKAKGRA
ncbi:DUF4235 domain-containing protein [Kocuria palustris]|uniref:DUF4235 domain-containing protein n=1 Tax=Kocuria palustris TaxID=71999 RepID=UPI0024691CE9|nr:DUF4235 domain-containing protein [Kocuria palustris]MDH5151419.1 DUF4235 domain-containing protein [Kocuria palustris]